MARKGKTLNCPRIFDRAIYEPDLETHSMTKEQLIEQLQELPDGTEIYIAMSTPHSTVDDDVIYDRIKMVEGDLIGFGLLRAAGTPMSAEYLADLVAEREEREQATHLDKEMCESIETASKEFSEGEGSVISRCNCGKGFIRDGYCTNLNCPFKNQYGR